MTFTQAQLDQLYGFCFALTHKEDKAFDLLQSSLEKYLKNPPEETESAKSYIKKIIHNHFIDQYRKEIRHKLESFDETTSELSDFDIMTLEALIINEDEIDKILQYLDPIDREILYLWSVEGYTTEQLSQLLEMPKGTILSRISRMRVKITSEYSSKTGEVI